MSKNGFIFFFTFLVRKNSGKRHIFDCLYFLSQEKLRIFSLSQKKLRILSLKTCLWRL